MTSSPISILEFVQTCAQAFIAESGEQLIDSLLEHDEAYGEALREAIRDVCAFHTSCTQARLTSRTLYGSLQSLQSCPYPNDGREILVLIV